MAFGVGLGTSTWNRSSSPPVSSLSNAVGGGDFRSPGLVRSNASSTIRSSSEKATCGRGGFRSGRRGSSWAGASRLGEAGGVLVDLRPGRWGRSHMTPHCGHRTRPRGSSSSTSTRPPQPGHKVLMLIAASGQKILVRNPRPKSSSEILVRNPKSSSEIRNPKSEIRNRSILFGFRISDFGFRTRISDEDFYITVPSGRIVARGMMTMPSRMT